MDTQQLEKFNPTVVELQRMVSESKGITVSDFNNSAQIKLVREHRIKLRNARSEITKQGKIFRQEAIDFQKAVIGREKELIALIEPEEIRLKELEEESNRQKEIAERVKLLPHRRERLDSINDGIDVTDEELLGMDGSAFEGYLNKRLADKNEKDRQELAEKQAELQAEEDRIARQKELEAAKEEVRIAERIRAEKAEVDLKEQRERELKESKERIKREEREAKERIIKAEVEAKEKLAREERERKEKVEAEKQAEIERKEALEKDEKYNKFLAEHGYNQKTASEFYIETVGTTHILYKKVGEIKL